MKGTKTLLSYILFIIGYQYKPICCLPDPPCEKDYFQCLSKDCIPDFWRCDGQEDCEDGSDENQCGDSGAATSPKETLTCDEGELKCQNDRCIDAEWACDGEDDCGDGTDEQNCPARSTEKPPLRACDETSNFRCKNGKCVPKSWTCNKVDDCGDNSDESTSEAPNCVPFEGCKDTHFQCAKTGACIHRVLVCDLGFDCGTDANGTLDKSDEAQCANRSCEASEFKCANDRCVSKQWRCDKQDDCGDGSDENDCQIRSCPSDKFRCVSSGQCISGSFRCDEFDDCMDGSDEKNCDSKKTRNTTVKPFTVVDKRTTILPTTTTKSKVYTTASGCRVGQYKCKNEQRCLHSAWKCDGEADCKEMDDESEEVCSSHKCEAHHFRCANQKCILMRNKCDGIDQCGDNSDEKHCETAQVPCTSDTYRCQGSSKCILKTSVCDGKNDCFWDDDEDKRCDVNECLVNNGGCPHACVDLPIGHRCECPLGHELEPNSNKCLDINECHVFGKCSQACVNYKGSFACQCDRGYSMDPHDNRTCRADGPTPYLMFTNRYDVRQMTTDGRHSKLITPARDATLLSLHYSDAMLYYADLGQNTISRVKVNKTGAESQLLVSDVAKPEGLVVDWLGHKLYWSEGTLNQILVSNLDGSHKKVIVQGAEEHEIKAIEVYPEKGLIFWSTYGTHCEIMRSNLDGSNQTVVIGKEHQLNWPTSITLDKTTNRLYWAELSSICTVTLDGRGFKRILYGLTRPYGIAVFEDHVYWTDFVEKTIYKANKFNGLGKMAFEGNFTLPQDIAVYHPLTQMPVEHPCRHINGGCSHLCFMTPSAGRVCACPGLMTLDGDGKTCSGSVEASTTSTVPTTEATTAAATTQAETTVIVEKETTVAPTTTVQTVQTTTTTTEEPTTAKPAETTAPESIKTTSKPTTTRKMKEKTTVPPPKPTEEPFVPLASTVTTPETTSDTKPVVIYTDDIEDEVAKSSQKSTTVKIAVIVVSLAGFVVILILGLVCYRRKRTHFDLSMVYESHRDYVHEKEDDEEKQAKYTIPQNKKSKAFDNINFNNGNGSLELPVSGDEIPDMVEDDYGASDDVCYDDDAPIMQNMV